MIAAQVLGFSSPSCSACAGTPAGCPNGCDTLPCEVLIHPEGASGNYLYLANSQVLSACAFALASPEEYGVALTDAEADALVSVALLDELAWLDTHPVETVEDVTALHDEGEE